MSPDDDDQGVQAARDEAVIAGRAMTGDDAALVGLVEVLREGARRPAPTPSPELAALLTHGVSPELAKPMAEVVDLGAVRARRRRAARYVVSAGLAAGLALGGSAAAAAVHDGVPLSEVPGEIGHRISTTVTGALASLGLRPGNPAPDRVPDPLPGSSESSAPGRSGDAPGQQGGAGDDPGRSGEAPGAPRATPDPGQDPGRSGEAPGRQDQTPAPATTAPGRSGDAPGHQDQTVVPGAESGANDAQGSTGAQGAADPASSAAAGRH